MRSMRVVIVDDNPSVRFALRILLEHLGHEVVGFSENGQDALEIVSLLQPDVVVMDVKIPKIDGLSCTAKLIKMNPNVRVIVVTAGRTTENQVINFGAHGFVRKPFELSELNHAISAAILNQHNSIATKKSGTVSIDSNLNP